MYFYINAIANSIYISFLKPSADVKLIEADLDNIINKKITVNSNTGPNIAIIWQPQEDADGGYLPWTLAKTDRGEFTTDYAAHLNVAVPRVTSEVMNSPDEYTYEEVYQKLREMLGAANDSNNNNNNNNNVAAQASTQQSSNTSAAPAAKYGSVVGYALSFQGVPYVSGGTSPSGFDCSGLVQYVFAAFGKQLPRTVASQKAVSTPISESQLQPGDLVFWGVSHVGIYIGGGNFVHAPTTGDHVKVTSMNYYHPDSYGRVN